MTNAENSLYVAKVTDEGVKTMHADENAVYDAQIGKIFKKQNEDRKDKENDAIEDQRKIARQVAVKKRRQRCMAKEVSGLLGAAALVYLTYKFGLYVAIASITGCIMAATCRFVGYLEKGREAYGRESCPR